MPSGNHIPIRFNQPPKQIRRSAVPRFGNEVTNDDLRKEIQNISKDLVETQNKLNEVLKHNEENYRKLNDFKTTIERTQQATANSVITQINNSGGGSSSSGKTIVQVSKSLSAGVASAEVFAAPSRLLGLPIAYAVVDGMGSTETLTPSSLTTSGFSITALQDATVIYSYQYI